MVKHKQGEQWQRIRALIARRPEDIGLQAIIDGLSPSFSHGPETGDEFAVSPRRTLQSCQYSSREFGAPESRAVL